MTPTAVTPALTFVDALTLTFVLGLASAGATAVARALAWPSLLSRKPLSCDLCMSWWGSLALVFAWWSVLGRPHTADVGVFLATVQLGAVGVSVLGIKTAKKLDGFGDTDGMAGADLFRPDDEIDEPGT